VARSTRSADAGEPRVRRIQVAYPGYLNRLWHVSDCVRPFGFGLPMPVVDPLQKLDAADGGRSMVLNADVRR